MESQLKRTIRYDTMR